MAISDFQISGQFFNKQNCYNLRTNDFIDMKLGLVTKIDKANNTTSIKGNSDVIFANYEVVDSFLIYGQFGVIQIPDSRCIVCETYILINSNLLLWKN